MPNVYMSLIFKHDFPECMRKCTYDVTWNNFAFRPNFRGNNIETGGISKTAIVVQN